MDQRCSFRLAEDGSQRPVPAAAACAAPTVHGKKQLTEPVARPSWYSVPKFEFTVTQTFRARPPVYRVKTSDPLSAIQRGEVALAACPHGLTRLGSVTRATPAMSETRFTC